MPNDNSKFIRFLFYFLILSLSFNLRHIFNFAQISSLEGFRENISYSLYLFDLILLWLLITVIYHKFKTGFTFKKALFKKFIFLNPLTYFLISLFISGWLAYNHSIALYNSFRIIFALIFFFISLDLLKNKKVFYQSVLIIFIGGIIQSMIALFQFYFQKSINLKFLGESLIASDELGVAKFEFNGEKFIRAYGTFPHPNLLGAFLFLSLTGALWLATHKKILRSLFGYLESSRKHFPFLRSSIYGIMLLLGSITLLAGIILSYSRSVILVTFIFLIIAIFSHRFQLIKIYQKLCDLLHIHRFLRGAVALVFFFLTLFISYNLVSPRLCFGNCLGDNSLQLRQNYVQWSRIIIKEHPLWGVGMGNFTFLLKHFFHSFNGLAPWEIQPVHNLYLIITTEIGLVGLITFLFILIYFIFAHFRKVPSLFFIDPSRKNLRKNLANLKKRKKSKRLFAVFLLLIFLKEKIVFYLKRLTPHLQRPFFILFFLFLLLGFFDHYFWTLPQGQFIFCLVLALFYRSSEF